MNVSALAGEVTIEAIGYLPEMFGTPAGAGVQMAVRATRSLIAPDDLPVSIVTLTNDLLAAT